MTRLPRRRVWLALGGGVVAVALVTAAALPVAGQDPSPSPAATEKPGNGPKTEKPGNGPNAQNGPKAEKPGKGPQAAKVPEVPVTLTGRVGTRTDAGDTVFTLSVNGTVYDLHAGPPWWWGADHPLAAFVGKRVTVTGEQAQGTADVDVLTVDGQTIREPGRPPWAGGWKAVGAKHPGWAQWKADRFAEKIQGKATGRPSWAGPKTPEASESPG